MFYCEVVIYAGDIKYSYSIVKQYAWVLKTQMRDLPLKILDFCTLRKGVFYTVLGLLFILTRVNSPHA